MLAIADFAKDDGEAWPSVRTIAAKSRLKERQTQYALSRLVRSGELKISQNKGPRGCHLYHITIPENTRANIAGVQEMRGAIFDRGGAISGTLGVHSTAPEPSFNRHKNRHSPSQAQSPPSPAIADSGENPSSSSKSAKCQKSAKLKKIPLLPSQAGLEFADWFHSTLPESFSLAESWREECARTFDALVRIDQRTPEEIWRVCKWARADSFWASRFLSPLKLRHRNRERVTYFDAFSAQMNGNKPCRPKPPESFI
jgi:hypothetical protein